MKMSRPPTSLDRLRIRVTGAVQGVGFRPFVHRLAARHGLSGFVLNDADGVVAEIEGTSVDDFMTELQREPPPLARIDGVNVTPLPPNGQHGFTIRPSAQGSDGASRIVPDAATCLSCLDDLFDPASRFYGYPFVTCTNCGPRFTIARRSPYDRGNTSMAEFPLCDACAVDYADPASRRFHAETIACAACGPRLSHRVQEIAAALTAGQIVALKGIGGYNLVCDALNETAVQTLRDRKRRPHKPFAVMVANAACAESICEPTRAERALLRHTAGPIVMIPGSNCVAPSVAPGLDRIGVMLPSAPVHHLLFRLLGSKTNNPSATVVLMATSGNEAGQPLITDDAHAHEALAGIADMIVTHNRPILARADDSVMTMLDGAPFFIRRARGFVPDPIDLGEDGPTVLAAGGQLKATLCVTRGREAFVSQHIGDLTDAATVRFYRDTARDMLAKLGSLPELVACDLHPDYRSTLFADGLGLPVLRVQHHAAHLAATVAEHYWRTPVLGVALDGHGYGDDGGAWGGELIALHGAQWRRCGHLLPLALPGGDYTAREPWRMGVAALASLGRGAEAAARFPTVPHAGRLAAWLATATTAPPTTSMGRWFDAAAALLGVCTHQSYEGQAAMQMEALVRSPVCMQAGWNISHGVLDFRPVLASLLEPGMSVREGAELFHGTLIEGLAAWIGECATRTGHTDIVLGGGCLANIVLTEGLVHALRVRGFVVLLPRAVPANDGGLSFGQAALARAHLKKGLAA